MKSFLSRLAAVLTVACWAWGALAGAGTPPVPPGTDLYTLGLDSKPQDGVPRGKLIPRP